MGEIDLVWSLCTRIGHPAELCGEDRFSDSRVPEFRINHMIDRSFKMVPEGGIEPPTKGL